MQRHKFLEHRFHVVFAGLAAVRGLPAPAYSFDLRDFAYMHLFMGAHRSPGFLDGNGHAFALIDLNEDDGRRITTVVQGCARPIQKDRLHWSTVRTLKTKVHGLSAEYLLVMVRVWATAQ